MLVRISSKGQLVIPRDIRRQLGLKTGQQIEVRLLDKKIVLEPVIDSSPLNLLYGLYQGHDLLTELETEHRQEIKRDVQ